MVLLNGKMTVHKIEFKIRVLILNKRTLMLSGQPVGHQPESQMFTTTKDENNQYHTLENMNTIEP